jgi:hypothetical protein
MTRHNYMKPKCAQCNVLQLNLYPTNKFYVANSFHSIDKDFPNSPQYYPRWTNAQPRDRFVGLRTVDPSATTRAKMDSCIVRTGIGRVYEIPSL